MNFVNTGISVVHRSTKSQVYPLIFGSQNVPVYCHMGSFGCGDGGWTLAMKIDGKKVYYFTIKEYHCCKLYTTIIFLFSTFQVLEWQKYLQPSRRKDWLWLRGDQITDLLEHTLEVGIWQIKNRHKKKYSLSMTYAHLSYDSENNSQKSLAST